MKKYFYLLPSLMLVFSATSAELSTSDTKRLNNALESRETFVLQQKAKFEELLKELMKDKQVIDKRILSIKNENQKLLSPGTIQKESIVNGRKVFTTVKTKGQHPQYVNNKTLTDIFSDEEINEIYFKYTHENLSELALDFQNEWASAQADYRQVSDRISAVEKKYTTRTQQINRQMGDQISKKDSDLDNLRRLYENYLNKEYKEAKNRLENYVKGGNLQDHRENEELWSNWYDQKRYGFSDAWEWYKKCSKEMQRRRDQYEKALAANEDFKALNSSAQARTEALDEKTAGKDSILFEEEQKTRFLGIYNRYHDLMNERLRSGVMIKIDIIQEKLSELSTELEKINLIRNSDISDVDEDLIRLVIDDYKQKNLREVFGSDVLEKLKSKRLEEKEAEEAEKQAQAERENAKAIATIEHDRDIRIQEIQLQREKNAMEHQKQQEDARRKHQLDLIKQSNGKKNVNIRIGMEGN